MKIGLEDTRSGQLPIRLLCALAFAAALGLTLVMALVPQPPAFPVALSDKIQHATAFAVLAGLGACAWPSRLVQIALVLIIIGGLIEILQMIPPLHRDAEFADWSADVAATLVTLLFVRLIQGKRTLAALAEPEGPAFGPTPAPDARSV
jgi:hypothetical protein